MAFLFKQPQVRCTAVPSCHTGGRYKVVGGVPRNIYNNVCMTHARQIEARLEKEEAEAGLDHDTLMPIK